MLNEARRTPLFMPASANAVPAPAATAPTALFMDMDHQLQRQQYEQRPQQRARRKRKAENDAGNERLSKRMSLLNLGTYFALFFLIFFLLQLQPVLCATTVLTCDNRHAEQNGPKLYVPVEQSPSQAALQQSITALPHQPAPIHEEEPMHLDDTAHKVYIYNLDDELSSDNESDVEGRTHGDGKLVFLPDIEKHLRANRLASMVPRPILPNQDGELAGMQLVLYSDGPSSLSVPEEQDSVRKAIIEARARVRQRQAEERGALSGVEARQLDEVRSRTLPNGNRSFATPVRVPARALDEDMMLDQEPGPSPSQGAANYDDDPDAMDID